MVFFNNGYIKIKFTKSFINFVFFAFLSLFFRFHRVLMFFINQCFQQIFDTYFFNFIIFEFIPFKTLPMKLII